MNEDDSKPPTLEDLQRLTAYHQRRYWFWTAVTVVLLAISAMLFVSVIVDIAHATPARPCGMGGNNRENRDLARCLSREPGINVNRAKAVSVGDCESGFNRRASSGPYKGIYQLGSDEFDTFQHQGPRWVDQEFREHDYGIYSARGNILAAFAHAHDHGWGAWSCA